MTAGDRTGHAAGAGWARQLLAFTKGQHAKLCVSLGCALVSVGGGIVPYLAAYELLERALDGSLAEGDVGHWALVAACGAAVQAGGYLASTATSHSAAYHTLENLRNAVCEHLAACPLGEVQAMGAGAFKKKAVDDVEQLEMPIAHVIPEFTSNVALMAACLAIVWAMDWRLGLAMLVAPALSLVPLVALFRGFDRDYAAYWEASERVNATLVEYVKGIEPIKTFNQADSSYERYRDDITAFERLTLAWYRTSRVPMNALYAILPTLLVGVLPVGCALAGAGAVTLAQLALACMLCVGLAAPLAKVTRYTNMFKQIEKAMGSVADLLALEPLPEVKEPARVSSHDVSFEDVRFAYGSGEVLHGVTLHVPEGRSCALVGPSGSGKSTMAKLLARFWDVSAGSVRIGGVDVRDMPLDQLSGLVSFVTQDNYLFDRSVMENVRLGRPGASDDEVRRALAAARADDLERRLPQGLDTLVGQDGAALSGGERQRVSLARAYLKDAPILVLDEATAFVDPEGEEQIQQALSELARDKTLLVIAHRISTVRTLDRIAVLDQGRVEDMGTHGELLERCDLYRRLWEAHVGRHGGKGVPDASGKGVTDHV